MKPTTLKERLGLDEDMELVEAEGAATEGMSDEELKIESLKIATNISNVTTEDIVSIAETVAKFIKGGEGASLETSSPEEDTTADTEEDFTTDEPEKGEDTENESTESEEDFEV